ncbi:transporter substrate-binding domain-containing protein [Ruegeria arenilitoris]|uniref:transporter substrate-binding domain-containing protein n=1 Tax=Ruegeria arenilitoris TaxID=1173585 RepID=UPI00147D6F51|nr:transporter substrate-binding domain-containing protein [Ruegeria arenilitoris]
MPKLPLHNVAMTSAAVIALSAGAAAAQQACTNYTVQDGDTMATIAIAAYGTSNYQPIFNANRNSINNPNDLAPGLSLVLPCEDGSLPNGQSAREIIAQQQERFASSNQTSSFKAPIKLVTGNGWAPFADETLNGGGFITRLGTTALQRAGNAHEYSISFVDDWNSHIETLLPLGAFDVSMAWNMPDCTNRSYEWSWETEIRCTQFHASAPVYDIVLGFYTLPQSDYASATSFDDLKGATVCRMEGWFIHDLEQEGLQPAKTIDLLQPVTARECLDAVLTGSADVATFEVQLFADAMAEMGLNENDLVENPYVTTLSALRFITHRSNPMGKQYLAMLNKGLNEMRESGEWYAIISDTLNEHNERLIASSG